MDTPERFTDQPQQASSVFQAFDYARTEVLGRLVGLTDDELMWEPVPDCWSIRQIEGRLIAEIERDSERDIDPAPFTTIAWRLWHIAVDCFDSYSIRAFASSGSGLAEETFVRTAAEATDILDRSLTHFVTCMTELGADIWKPIGPEFGPFAEASHVDLMLHAYRELVHHGAEIGVLRDLYRLRS